MSVHPPTLFWCKDLQLYYFWNSIYVVKDEKNSRDGIGN